MLACIACSKHDLEDGEEDAARGATNPANKEAVKSLTSQIKDMVLKFSGSYRQCKGGSSSYRSKSFNHHHGGGGGGSYLHDDAVSEASGHHGHLHPASSSSTPAWDFLSINDESRYKTQWIHGAGMAAADASLEDMVVLEDNREPREWMAQVEPGVHITFVSLPGGAGNDLKRIRFSREMFNKWQAQRWWGENYDRIMELYNVQRFNRQALSTPPRSDDGGQRESFCSRVGSTRESPVAPPVARFTCRPPPPPPSGKGVYFPTVPDPSEHLLPYHLLHSAAAVAGVSGVKGETSSVDASRTTTSSRDEASISISNASELEVTEWVEQDEPGVYITIRELADGSRELRRVRFSRERFGEVHAKLWWEENRERIQAQYL